MVYNIVLGELDFFCRCYLKAYDLLEEDLHNFFASNSFFILFFTLKHLKTSFLLFFVRCELYFAKLDDESSLRCATKKMHYLSFFIRCLSRNFIGNVSDALFRYGSLYPGA